MSVLVTDAYSPSNLGDGELVRLTIDACQRRFDDSIVVLATDPLAFRSDPPNVSFVEKALSRASWREMTGARRASWFVRQFASLAVPLGLTLLPVGQRGRRAANASLASVLGTPWLAELGQARVVVGVGGGYIGDNYLRESLTTLVVYRTAVAQGSVVETMPLSISSARSRILRLALRLLGRGVEWRSREETTAGILRSLGLRSTTVPDLAWLNALEEPVSRPAGRAGLAIAPLGSAFYEAAPDAEPRCWGAVVEALENHRTEEPVVLIAMHSWDARLQDGKDDEACRKLAERIQRHAPDVEVVIATARDYEAVRAIMAGSRLAVCERLHAAIAALTCGTPTKVVGYEPKHVGVLRLAGLEDLATNSVLEIESRFPAGWIQGQAVRQACLSQQSAWAFLT